MARSPRSMSGPDRSPASRVAALRPTRGRAAAAIYLRTHLYGAAVGRTILDRCISAVDSADRARLAPFRGQFDEEIATARRLLTGISPVGAPGLRMVRASATVAFAALPAGPIVREPLTRLGLLESLRTLVVAKRSMWELLAESWVGHGDGTAGGDKRDRDGDGDGGSDGEDDDDGDGDGALITGDTRSVLLALADQARSQENLLEELRRSYGLELFE